MGDLRRPRVIWVAAPRPTTTSGQAPWILPAMTAHFEPAPSVDRGPAEATSGSVRIRYFLRVPNVGDRVNPSIVTGLTGEPTRFECDDRLPHLLCIGSLMASAGPASLVWGTGVMHPDLGLGAPQSRNIFAVRGELSAAALRRAGLLAQDVPFGDPALLAPGLLGIAAAADPRFSLGVVAHYVDRSHRAVNRLLALPGVRDLDVRLEPAEFLAAMADCRAIASSSLHGLIFAEALGLPSLWIQATNEIAGDGFKFRDWFTTTERPQQKPLRLDGSEQPAELAKRAERRASTVSTGELSAAFPRHRLAETRDLRPCRVTARMARRRSHPLPVFVISFNRGAMLRRCLTSLRRLDRPTMPVIQDNGSTDPATLAILADLESEGTRVVRGPKISSADELNGVDHTIAAFFSEWSEPGTYVVTDCDIDMSIADPAALDVYEELLTVFRGAGCVGPMLRIRDIQPTYRLYGRVMNRHIEQFWHRRPTWVATSRGRIAVQECPIDTTFALHRAAEPFRRLKPAVRVYEPYEALHLDWYDESRFGEQAYRETSHPGISHWNNLAEEKLHGDEPLRHDSFYAVCRNAGGEFTEYVHHVAGPAAGSSS
jgi:hypothetical protein